MRNILGKNYDLCTMYDLPQLYSLRVVSVKISGSSKLNAVFK